MQAEMAGRGIGEMPQFAAPYRRDVVGLGRRETFRYSSAYIMSEGASEKPPGKRLDSWKEIAAHLQ